MKTIARYLVMHILGFTAIVALALVAIFTFISFVAEIDETGQGGFGVAQLMYYTVMMMPSGLYTLLPIIAMLGTLMGLGTLASQNELTAMRAAGVSLLRIGGATLMAGAALGVLSILLGDWLAPAGVKAAEAFKTEARYGIETGVVSKPVWLRDGRHMFLIQRLLGEHHVAEVSIFEIAPDNSLKAALHVEEGRYRDGFWHFSKVRRTDFGEGSASASRVPDLVWQGGLSPEVLRLYVLEANSLSAPGLMRLISYLDENGLDATQYRLQLWRKLVAPLTVMAMMLFAVPFVLGPLRNAGAGQRLLLGVLVGLAFYVTNEVTASLGQLFEWPAAMAAGSPTAVFAVLGAYRLARAR